MMHVIVITLPAYPLDDAAEPDIAIVAVVERSHGSSEATLGEQIDIVLQRFQLETMFVEHRPEDIAGAASVCQQLMNRNGSDVAAGVIGQIVAQRIIQPDPARLNELHDRYAGEHLA